MPMPKPGTSQGFTLVELMVTIVVAAILVAIAAPSFADFLDKARLRGVADQVVDLINSSRVDSVKQGREVNVAFVGSTTAWCVGANVAEEPTNPGDKIKDAVSCNCNVDATKCLLEGQQAAVVKTSTQGVSIDALPADITFARPMGVVKSLDTRVAKFTSPRGKFTLQMTVTPLGQVSLCVPSTSKRPLSEFPSC